MKPLIALISLGSVFLAQAAPARTIAVRDYKEKVYGAWMGQIVGAIFGWPFEGRVKNVLVLDGYRESPHFKTTFDYAPVDDDYFYEMVALYGFERFGLDMSVEQLGEIWKQNQAGSWGSSLEARLRMAKGIQAPDTGSPRYNKWFHTIGPQFSADIYGMVSPGMINVAGGIARRYAHVNGYAEGADGAVFVAACVSEAFFEKDPVKIVEKAARLIDPRSNYRQAIDQVLEGHRKGVSFAELAHQTEDRWRAEYPQMNNAVANGALVAIGVLYGGGDFMKSLNVTTQLADYADADCNAANVGAILGAMNGVRAIPEPLKAQFHDRIWGEAMGPVKFDKVVDEKISDLAARIAVIGQRNALAQGARGVKAGADEVLRIPVEEPKTQAYEHFDINDYGPLWNPAWKLDGAGRGGAGTTFLDGDVLVTFPRDTRPCRLETEMTAPQGAHRLLVEVRAESGKPWRLEAYVDDDAAGRELVESADWRTVSIDLSKVSGKRVKIRLYQQAVDAERRAAYWKNARIE